jgi:hypothetical protein
MHMQETAMLLVFSNVHNLSNMLINLVNYSYKIERQKIKLNKTKKTPLTEMTPKNVFEIQIGILHIQLYAQSVQDHISHHEPKVYSHLYNQNYIMIYLKYRYGNNYD